MADAVAAETTQSVTGAQGASGQTGTNAGSAQATTTAAPQVFVDADGKLMSGWKDKYVPQDIRQEKIFDTYSSIDQMAKSLAYYNKRMRDTGRGIPDESWSPTELETYHTMRGRPAKPEDYGLKKAEGIPDEYYDQDRMNRFMQFAHKIGFTAKEVQAINTWNDEEVKQGIVALQEQQAQAKIQAEQESERILREKCGTNYETFNHLFEKFVDENTRNLDEEEYKKFVDAVKDPRIKPYLLPILAQVERKHFTEAGQVTEFEPPNKALTKEEAGVKAKSMQANKMYADGSMAKNDPAGYKEYQKQIDELFRFAGS